MRPQYAPSTRDFRWMESELGDVPVLIQPDRVPVESLGLDEPNNLATAGRDEYGSASAQERISTHPMGEFPRGGGSLLACPSGEAVGHE